MLYFISLSLLSLIVHKVYDDDLIKFERVMLLDQLTIPEKTTMRRAIVGPTKVH